MGANLENPGDEHIVCLRADVLNDAEHALGNLFQRMYHVTRVARDGLGPYADRMTDTLQDLERLLQLVFDYVSPVDVEVRPLDAARVVESLASHLRGVARGEVETAPRTDAEVLADTRTLGRTFQLLTLALTAELGAAESVVIDVEPDPENVTFRIRMTGPGEVRPEPRAALAWEVASRLVELQGGEVSRSNGTDCGICSVVLPAADGSHAGS